MRKFRPARHSRRTLRAECSTLYDAYGTPTTRLDSAHSRRRIQAARTQVSVPTHCQATRHAPRSRFSLGCATARTRWGRLSAPPALKGDNGPGEVQAIDGVAGMRALVMTAESPMHPSNSSTRRATEESTSTKLPAGRSALPGRAPATPAAVVQCRRRLQRERSQRSSMRSEPAAATRGSSRVPTAAHGQPPPRQRMRHGARVNAAVSPECHLKKTEV